MKFTFKKYIRQLILYDTFITLFIIIFFLLFQDTVFILFAILVIFICNINFFRIIYNIKKFLKEQPNDIISKLEKDLSNNYLIYDSWYLTDEYMFSVERLEKINYKDIMVVEGWITLVSGRNNNLGYKQTIYLKNGEKYKPKAPITSSNSDIFTEFIKGKNSSTYFGIIEDYMKIKKDI